MQLWHCTCGHRCLVGGFGCLVLSYAQHFSTEDCKLVVNATECSKLALFANTITDICGGMTMLVYYIVDSAYQLHFYFAFCK